jgi:hypothetical protein
MVHRAFDCEARLTLGSVIWYHGENSMSHNRCLIESGFLFELPWRLAAIIVVGVQSVDIKDQFNNMFSKV